MDRPIKLVQLLHLGLTPAEKRVVKLIPGVDGIEVLEEVDRGILANGAHLYPWGMVMRVDYERATQVNLDPLEQAVVEAAEKLASETHTYPVGEHGIPVIPGVTAAEPEVSPAQPPEPKKRGRRRRKDAKDG